MVWYLKTLFDNAWNKSSFSKTPSFSSFFKNLITKNKVVHPFSFACENISFQKAKIWLQTVEAEKIVKK